MTAGKLRNSWGYRGSTRTPSRRICGESIAPRDSREYFIRGSPRTHCRLEKTRKGDSGGHALLGDLSAFRHVGIPRNLQRSNRQSCNAVEQASFLFKPRCDKRETGPSEHLY